MDARFNSQWREVLEAAKEISISRSHEYIGVEHLLDALCAMAATNELIRTIFSRLSIDAASLSREIEKRYKPGVDEPVMGPSPQTPRAKKVIEYAMAASRDLEKNYFGAEHLLLGLVREAEGDPENAGVSAQVLKPTGVTYETAFEVVRTAGGASSGVDLMSVCRALGATHGVNVDYAMLADRTMREPALSEALVAFLRAAEATAV